MLQPEAIISRNGTDRRDRGGAVALTVVDPVGSGLVASISHPGGNLTGLSLGVTPETSAKMVQLLIEAVPGLNRLGVLWNSGNPGSRLYLDAVRQVARSLRLSLEANDVRRAEDLDVSFRALHGSVEGLIVFPESLLWTYRRQIVDASRAERLASIFGYRDAAVIGALMSRNPDHPRSSRRRSSDQWLSRGGLHSRPHPPVPGQPLIAERADDVEDIKRCEPRWCAFSIPRTTRAVEGGADRLASLLEDGVRVDGQDRSTVVFS
jgi:hypothetical protein